ncbi:GNAT family N-acetyltransferase [Candidatus Gottesmanbacteria bacterium]|nr:GNAT family N-acetyltransferase [Candidatus Gottesmanbacteria bacterium]
MKIRKIELSDFDDLYELWKEAGLDMAEIEREKREFEMMIELNPTSSIVLEQKARVIGSALGIFNGRRGMIYHLALEPKWQGKGYGSLLLKEVEKRLQQRGATKFNLFVSLENLKIFPFYEKHGYSVMSDSIVLAKDLWKK